MRPGARAEAARSWSARARVVAARSRSTGEVRRAVGALRATAAWTCLSLALALLAACGSPSAAPGWIRVEEAPADTVLFVDARVVGPASAAADVPVAAGSHVIEARRGAAIAAHEVVEVPAGAVVPIRLVSVEAAPVPSAAPAPSAVPAPSAAPPPDMAAAEATADEGTAPAVAGPLGVPAGDPPAAETTVARASVDPVAAELGADVALVIRRNQAGLRRCFEEVLHTDPGASARLDVSAAIAADGTVSSVEIGRAAPAPAALVACVERTVRGWRFPASGGATTVTFPVVFTAG